MACKGITLICLTLISERRCHDIIHFKSITVRHLLCLVYVTLSIEIIVRDSHWYCASTYQCCRFSNLQMSQRASYNCLLIGNYKSDTDIIIFSLTFLSRQQTIRGAPFFVIGKYGANVNTFLMCLVSPKRRRTNTPPSHLVFTTDLDLCSLNNALSIY